MKKSSDDTTNKITMLSRRLQKSEMSRKDGMAMTKTKDCGFNNLIQIMSYQYPLYEYRKNGEIWFGFLK